MKIKEGFMLREIAGTYTVVAVGKASMEFKGIINLNEVGAFIWRHLEKSSTPEQIVTSLLSEYEVDKDVATKDVDSFIEQLKEANILEY